MGLRDIKLPSETIQVTDDINFVVRGLGAREIIKFVTEYKTAVQPLFDKLSEIKTDGTDSPDVSGLAKEVIDTVLRSAPDLIAEIIATAADEFDSAGVMAAANLPPTVMILAIERIFFLTFRTEAERKNAVETVIRAIQGTAGILKTVTDRR